VSRLLASCPPIISLGLLPSSSKKRSPLTNSADSISPGATAIHVGLTSVTLSLNSTSALNSGCVAVASLIVFNIVATFEALSATSAVINPIAIAQPTTGTAATDLLTIRSWIALAITYPIVFAALSGSRPSMIETPVSVLPQMLPLKPSTEVQEDKPFFKGVRKSASPIVLHFLFSSDNCAANWVTKSPLL